jgi:hypothetical protein
VKGRDPAEAENGHLWELQRAYVMSSLVDRFLLAFLSSLLLHWFEGIKILCSAGHEMRLHFLNAMLIV